MGLAEAKLHQPDEAVYGALQNERHRSEFVTVRQQDSDSSSSFFSYGGIVGSSERVVTFYQTTRHHIPEGNNLHIHRLDNLKSHVI
jgi:hypothetical protein